MTQYEVDPWDFQRLVDVAAKKPDQFYADTMGGNYPEQLRRWRENLRQVVDMIAAKAWIKGGAWVKRAGKREYMVVTQEQYEILKREADAQAPES